MWILKIHNKQFFQEEAKKGNALTLLISELGTKGMENKHGHKYAQCMCGKTQKELGGGQKTVNRKGETERIRSLMPRFYDPLEETQGRPF